ncbi:hypothetical protein [Streptomyces brasiliensis]|uniref:WD40 repeat domain-containing protein n=1 Tax=Streptomyces brasiliensis TaxID=1954 RepID=A0A917KKF2_9ACTN|nr:hypothetical protein [Streptomyces brasiliensis]GGJ14788.1 hypothetical protein GCM10010121_026790 [Streptomyces brasiliensis]
MLVETAASVRSLVWRGGELVEVVGGLAWDAGGVERRVHPGHGAGVDRAVVSPSGRYSVVYAERGTTALVLDGARVVRELTRSPYHAKDFDYPVTLGSLPDGREVLVHCPDEYDVLQMEEVESGKRLTAGAREAKDVFHSRLSVTPDGRHLLVAGWVWHPYGIVEVFDLDGALKDPAVLDGRGTLLAEADIDAEVESACWLDDDRLVVATGDEDFLDEDEAPAFGPRRLGVWSLSGRGWLHRNPVGFKAGTLIAGGGRVVSLHGRPRLVDVTTGAVLAEWPEVEVARREGPYGVTHVPTPVAALHPDGTCLAIAVAGGIAVLPLPDAGG